jgi:hypothetical protein
MLKVLYDGWSLARRPNGPASLHLLTLLALKPESVQAAVALPGDSFHNLPEEVERVVVEIPDTPGGRLRWEQFILPHIGREQRASLMHTFESAALFGSCPSVLSPASPGWQGNRSAGEKGPTSLARRLRDALNQGGFSRLQAFFWPANLEGIPGGGIRDTRRILLPPAVHPAFESEIPHSTRESLEKLTLPESWILYHGPGTEEDLRRLLRAWRWAAGPIGEAFPLLVVGLTAAEEAVFGEYCRAYQVQGSARSLGAVSIDQLAALYRLSSVVFHPADSPAWGSALHLALACARPVVGLETRTGDALLGPAGYLVKDTGTEAEQERALGAALITVIVEERLADDLTRGAHRRMAGYEKESFSRALGEAYTSLT